MPYPLSDQAKLVLRIMVPGLTYTAGEMAELLRKPEHATHMQLARMVQRRHLERVSRNAYALPGTVRNGDGRNPSAVRLAPSNLGQFIGRALLERE